MSLSIRPGESFGIVGPTGSGKSTLLDVMLGMLEPDAGAVTVDGGRWRQQREAWQRSIGYVPQDVYLVDDTLRANVALGWNGDEIDDERVVEAIGLAGLDGRRRRAAGRRWRRSSASAACGSRAASGSASGSLARSTRALASWFSTRPPRTWTRQPSTASSRRSPRCREG